MAGKIVGTTTQTGPDGLVRFTKAEALDTLLSLWGMKPKWLPRSMGAFRYPKMAGADFAEAYTGESALAYARLLDIQREKGCLTRNDLSDGLQFPVKRVEVIGSAYNTADDDPFLLDPVNETLFRLPASDRGVSLYKELYASRFHYIESIPNAFRFLGREADAAVNGRSATAAIGNTVVFVCGLGTGGGETAIRLGKQFPDISLVLVDGGVFGPENIDRQVATPANLGLNKAVAVAAKVYEINPLIKNLFCVPSYISKENVDSLFASLLADINVAAPSVQIVDEIDVTEKETLRAKAELHYAAIRLAKKLGRTVYVHWSLDLGASGEVVGTCRYTGSESEIFQGNYSLREAQLPAILAMYGLVPIKSVGLEMITDIRSRLKKDGKLEHVSQSGLSAIGVAKVISTRIMLVMFGYGHCLHTRTFHDDLRASFRLLPRVSAALRRMPYSVALKVYGFVKKRKVLKTIEKI